MSNTFPTSFIVLKPGAMRHVGKATLNGSSDFANEASASIAALFFNWVMMIRFGIDGVAAFAVINYILFTGLIIFSPLATLYSL